MGKRSRSGLTVVVDTTFPSLSLAQALERNPAVCHALRETPEWEVASHGYRWIDYRHVDEVTERDHIWRTVEIHERLLGKRPVGIYQGKVRVFCALENRSRARDVIVWEGCLPMIRSSNT